MGAGDAAKAAPLTSGVRPLATSLLNGELRMALLTCPDCGGKVSDIAPACPHCGRPMGIEAGKPGSPAPAEAGTKCPSCGKTVTPVVTSVGGGSCSVGRREKWSCPACYATIHRSGCFVATATYGDEDAIEVRFLRMFRERYLVTSTAGRLGIAIYYAVSPHLTNAIERLPVTRGLARVALDGLVRAIEFCTPLNRAAIRARLAKRSAPTCHH